jgi:hypothetical protein
MTAFLIECLKTALSRLREHAELVGLFNVDESTFRSFVLAEIMSSNSLARCQTEWEKNRIDLLCQMNERNVVVEFKFFVTRPMLGLDGSHLRWKGWASPENEGEFRACVEKLTHLAIKGIDDKFIVLAHEVSTVKKSRHSFVKSYQDLSRFGIHAVHPIDHNFCDTVMCKLIEVK